ncbi:MAG: hypothetical protein LBI05_02315, partial [Planctomycetaceae bacterium]|nr:hypothetical protein [Planctomycetaceae bacterium]
MLVEILIDLFGTVGNFVYDLGCFANNLVYFLSEITFMPSLEYTVVAWILRLAGIGIACYLWYLSIKLFKKNKWTIPGIVNFFAYCILFIACFEIDVVMYRCGRLDCLHVDREIYYGIMGVCVYKTEECISVRNCDDSERKSWKIVEERLWGGFIGALPCYDRGGITNFYFECPCCGSHVASYTLPKCKDCSDESLPTDDYNPEKRGIYFAPPMLKWANGVDSTGRFSFNLPRFCENVSRRIR